MRMEMCLGFLSGVVLAAGSARADGPVAGCGSWEVIASPNPAGSTFSVLHDISVIDPDDVWAVGSYLADYMGSSRMYTLAMHFDGQAWTIVPTPNPSPSPSLTYCGLEAVAAIAPDDVWAAGYKNDVGHGGIYVGTHMLVMHWDGASWEVVETPLPPYYETIYQQVSGDNIRDIVALGPDDIWFLGDWVDISTGLDQPRGLALHWDGESLTVSDTPFIVGTPGTGLEAGAALAPDDIWAVGGGSDGDDADLSMILHWDGESWTQVPGPTPGYFSRLYDVIALAPNDVWATGDWFDGDYHVLTLHWDGTSWTPYDSPAGGRALAALSPDSILNLGSGTVGYWDGADWGTTGPLPSSMISLAGADVFGPCAAWVAGRQFEGSVQSTFTARLNPTGPSMIPGDLNCDGSVDAFDIDAFVLAVTDAEGYAEHYPACSIEAADVNGDGAVDAFDIDPFVALLTG